MCSSGGSSKETKETKETNWNWWQDPLENRESLNGSYRLNVDSLSDVRQTSRGTSQLKIPNSNKSSIGSIASRERNKNNPAAKLQRGLGALLGGFSRYSKEKNIGDFLGIK